MDNKKLEEQRNFLKGKLEGMAALSKEIIANMSAVRKRNGVAHRALDPPGITYIVSDKKGFMATYRDTNGQLYEFSVKRNPENLTG